MELMQANRQWSSRPEDERYLSLTSMLEHFMQKREVSRQSNIQTRELVASPAQTDEAHGLTIGKRNGAKGLTLAPTNWAFGQLARVAKAPAGYLATLPAPMAADCLNWGLLKAPSEEVQLLAEMSGDNPIIRAATGPRYGRIWNAEILQQLVSRFGDGRTGDFRVPGEFGKAVDVTKANTTLFAGDRDMFVFLADEEHRIEVPNRRNGEAGSMARGFFCWNSEVGSATFGIATFLFDYVCCNRIVWGATEYKQVRVRHSSQAPQRFFSEISSALRSYANSSAAPVQNAIVAAQTKAIAHQPTEIADFLSKRFGKGFAEKMEAAHLLEEGKPIRTYWDAVTAATAVARDIPHQDRRVEIETSAGKLLDMAA